MAGVKTFWAPLSRRSRAESMWADGATFSAIAEAVGATRNAVASYIRRRGLQRSLAKAAAPAPQVKIEFPPKSFPLALPAPPKLLALPPAELEPYELHALKFPKASGPFQIGVRVLHYTGRSGVISGLKYKGEGARAEKITVCFDGPADYEQNRWWFAPDEFRLEHA